MSSGFEMAMDVMAFGRDRWCCPGLRRSAQPPEINEFPGINGHRWDEAGDQVLRRHGTCGRWISIWIRSAAKEGRTYMLTLSHLMICYLMFFLLFFFCWAGCQKYKPLVRSLFPRWRPSEVWWGSAHLHEDLARRRGKHLLMSLSRRVNFRRVTGWRYVDV